MLCEIAGGMLLNFIVSLRCSRRKFVLFHVKPRLRDYVIIFGRMWERKAELSNQLAIHGIGLGQSGLFI